MSKRNKTMNREMKKAAKAQQIAMEQKAREQAAAKALKERADIARLKYGYLTDEKILALYENFIGEEASSADEALAVMSGSKELSNKLAKVNMSEFEQEMKVNESRVNLIMKVYADFALRRVTPDDWNDAKELWNKLEEARQVVGSLDDRKVVATITADDVKRFINLFEAVNGWATFIPATYTLDQRIGYLKEQTSYFERKWFSEEVKKSCRQQLKMIMDIDVDPQTLTFDSRKANKEGTIFWISTAEDELWRIADSEGRQLLTLNMAEGDVAMKRRVFLEGVVDVATGIRYFFVWQGPSATRKADATFVSAKEVMPTANENFEMNVLPLWLKATGMTREKLFNKFMKDGKFILNKLNARLAVNSSDTFKIGSMSPEWAERIRNWKVVYGTDPEIRVTCPNKHLVNGVLVLDENGHDVVPGDGQCIANLYCKADLNAAVRQISDSDALLYKMLVNRASAIAERDGASEGIRFLQHNKEFNRINSRMSDFFQVRKEESIEKGGITFIYPWFMPKNDEGEYYDIFVPDSFVKAQGVNWEESNLMICNFLHNKKKYVVLGNQFIQALDSTNPTLLKPVVDYWFDQINKAMEHTEEGIATAMSLHGIVGEETDNDSLVKSAVMANPELLNDFYISDQRGKQIDKLIHEMLSGRIRVPGTYTYQVCDPAAILNMVFGLNNPTLSSGEQYFNDLSCNAGIFRSPKVAQCQAQRVSLVSNSLYFYTKDLFIHNAIDGVWDRLAGSDFDGDQIAVVPDNTEHGALVVSAIKGFDYDVCETKPDDAVKSDWSWENYCNLMAENISPDATGEITNNNSHFWEMYNHLIGFVSLYGEKGKGFTEVTFIDPTNQNHNRKLPVYDEFGGKIEPDVYTEMVARYPWVNNGKLYAPGFKQQVINPISKKYEFIDSPFDIVGTMTMNEVLEKAEIFFNYGEITAAFQGIEIDGAKTFVYAKDKGYGAEHQCLFVTGQMLARKKFLGRTISGQDWRNTYASCSMLGFINAHAQKREREYRAIAEEKRTNFVTRLYSLLSIEERAELSKPVALADGTTMNLLDYVRVRKESFNKETFKAMNIADEDAKSNYLSSLREAEVQILLTIVKAGFSIEAVASACYISAYNRTSGMDKGLSYGWLLAEDLLAVFSRGGKKTQLVRVPSTTLWAEVSGSVLYVNDRKYRAIDAYNGEVTVVSMNGYKYAKVNMRTTTANVDSMELLPSGSRFEGISLIGFAFNGTTVEEFKEAMKSGVPTVSLNAEGRLMFNVNGKAFAEVRGKDSFKLNGHTVTLMKSEKYKETEKSINGLVVYVK